jgi:hypothetical protein
MESIRYKDKKTRSLCNASKDISNDTFIDRNSRWHFEVLVDFRCPLIDLLLYGIIRKKSWKEN